MVRIKDRYISPLTDFGFKKLFGTEVNKDLLMDFLNELIGKDEGKIIDLSYMPKEQLGRSFSDRKAIFDLYCESQKGEKFIVEMQKIKQKFFKDRSIYYSTFPIQSQAEKGEWNFKLKSVYTIGILDFSFEENKDNHDVFYHEVQLFNKKTKKVFYDKLTYIYLELPKFKKDIDQLESHFDKWIFILKNLDDLTARPKKLQEKIFKKLFTQAEIANYSDQEYAQYEDSLKYYRDLKNSFDTAFEDGKKGGVAQIVLTMLKKGKAPDTIAGKTGINLKTIEAIKNRK